MRLNILSATPLRAILPPPSGTSAQRTMPGGFDSRGGHFPGLADVTSPYLTSGTDTWQGLRTPGHKALEDLRNCQLQNKTLPTAFCFTSTLMLVLLARFRAWRCPAPTRIGKPCPWKCMTKHWCLKNLTYHQINIWKITPTPPPPQKEHQKKKKSKKLGGKSLKHTSCTHLGLQKPLRN